MTPRTLLPLTLAVLAAGCATTASSREPARAGGAASPSHVAVVAGPDASAGAVAAAIGRLDAGPVTVHRVGGLQEAQAEAAALAADGFDRVVPIGATARTAVAEAAATGLGA